MNRRENVDFVGIGVGRSATTWLSICLQEHPQIAFSGAKSTKELKFFDDDANFRRGINWYLRQFPECSPGSKVGEFSPFYYLCRKAALRMRECFPNLKLLVIIRHPAEVVFSYYLYHRNLPWQATVADFDAAVSERQYSQLWIALGQYHLHLEHYFQIFGGEAILWILHDDILRDPDAVLRRVYSFLEVDTAFVAPSSAAIINRALDLRNERVHGLVKPILISLQKSAHLMRLLGPVQQAWFHQTYRRLNGKDFATYPRLPHISRERLVEFFLPDIQWAEHMLSRSLPHWR